MIRYPSSGDLSRPSALTRPSVPPLTRPPVGLQRDFAELTELIVRLEDLVRNRRMGTVLETRLSHLQRDVTALANEAQVAILNRPRHRLAVAARRSA